MTINLIDKNTELAYWNRLRIKINTYLIFVKISDRKSVLIQTRPKYRYLYNAGKLNGDILFAPTT